MLGLDSSCRLEVADPLLQKQFSYTALSGEPKLGVMEESLTNFKYFCTGRRFCTRFIVDFDVRRSRL